MHILVIPAWYDVSNPFLGSFFHEYCDALAEKAQVSVLKFNYFSFSQRFKSNEKIDLLKSRKYRLLSIDYFNQFPLNLAGESIYFQKKQIFKKVVNEVLNYQKVHGKIDIIHIQSVCHNINALIAYQLSEKLKIPYLITEHFSGFSESNEKIFLPFSNLAEVKNIVKNASVRFAVSQTASKYFTDFFDCKFDVMHNLVSNEFINKPLLYKVKNDFLTFLSIGRFDDNKGQLFLINSFAKALKIKPQLILKLVGSGVNKDKMKELVAKLNISSSVFIYDSKPKTQIIDLIDDSDVIISSSIKETFGLTIVEAFFRGKPVISTRSGGPNELVNKMNGMLVEYGDETAMTNSIVTMYNQINTFDSDKIREDAIKKYSENAIISMMMNVYNNIV